MFRRTGGRHIVEGSGDSDVGRQVATKRELLPQARALYAQGMSIEDIADVLGRSASTLYRWMRADSDAGREWSRELAGESEYDPSAVIRLIERRLQDLAEADADAVPSSTWFDAIYKALASLQRSYKLYGDLTLRLHALRQFVSWAMEAPEIPADDRSAIRRVVPVYLSHLKRRATS